MMVYPVGLFVAATAVIVSIYHLKQSVSFYFDMVGMTVVLGGTLAVAIITLPWNIRREIMLRLKKLFSRPQENNPLLIRECLEYIQKVEAGSFNVQIGIEGFAANVLKDGMELISLGFNAEKVENILAERINQFWERAQQVANAIRSLAKYPPAFGLTGTVLGLVSLMRAVSDGAGAQETGLRMSVALIATFYGLLVANLVINPAGENVLHNAGIERKEAEIALEAVLLAANKTSLLESQEMLNSFVPEKDRVSVLGMVTEEPEPVREANA